MTVDISIVLALILTRLLFINWSIVEFGFSLNRVVLWPLPDAIGEKVIFRLCLFYVIVKFGKDNKPPFFITILILVIYFLTMTNNSCVDTAWFIIWFS